MAEEDRTHNTSNNTSQDQDKLLEVLRRALRRNHSKKNRRIPQTFLRNGNINPNFLRSEDTPLTLVARHPSHIDILERLIEIEGLDMDIRDSKGRTALSYACELHEVRYVEVLLLNKAHPNLQDQEGRTPLSWAATPTGKRNNFSEVMELLLKYGADANKEDLQGWIPLMWAVSKGSDVIVADLLSSNPGNVNHQDTQGRTPLSLAAELEHQTILGLTEITGLLLEFEADVNAEDEDGYTPLGLAVIEGQKAIVGLLISSGADLEYKYQKHDCCTALLLATKHHEQFAVVDELLQQNAEVNCTDVHGCTPLALAAKQGFYKIVKKLSAHRDINIDTKDLNERTPLSLAAGSGRLQIVQYLIQQQADINSKDREGQTPLAWAIRQSKDSTVVEELLNNKTIDLEHQDVNDDSPLFLAAKSNNSLMHILMKAGANAMRIVNGHSCFWWLVKARFEVKNKPESSVPSRQLNSFQMLEIIPYHSDPDLQENNRTLLSWSAEYGDHAMVQALLEHGANPDIRDGPPINAQIQSIEAKRIDASSNFSKTPLIWALINGHLAVVDMLKEKDSFSLHLLIKERELLGDQEASKLVCKLLKTGYDINKLDSEGRCTLHLLSNVQDTKFAKALLDAKDVEFSLNLQDNARKTPLYYALKEKNEAFVRMLLEKGADTSNISAEAWFHLSNEAIRWIEFTQQDSGSISLLWERMASIDRRNQKPNFGKKRTLLDVLADVSSHSKQSLSFEPSESHISRRDQLLRQGRGQKIIQILAQNGVKRAELQRALRQHVEGLRQAIDEDTTIFPEQKGRLQAQVNEFDKSVNAKVFEIERAVRELLQIVRIFSICLTASNFSKGICLDLNQRGS
ncbi:ankyrin repeat domain-containing protein [Aspergillus saccharolyticus JOP 1030-1]|uniref:protein S-acyltransferase n=1 Tax=Aspergillus saccharolyticus JOP 1030-1 TaxID=1450539 RepID=A0A318Z4M5_9EURO|nr:ankyrin [Aspergillus saccharolyticus JOP 1030-1]PYH42265.1 ankyrin [Aspergillus saccharolyticus JOP 1030-1]